MNYKKFFESVLLEYSPTPSDGSDINLAGGQNTRRYPDGQSAFEGQLDDETNPDDFNTEGLKAAVDKIQARFNQKMSEFASTLDPDQIDNLTLNELRDKVEAVQTYVKSIDDYAGEKIENIRNRPQAIVAAFIASDPGKQNAFQELLKNLEDFSATVEEVENQIGSMKRKIDQFVKQIGNEEIPVEDLSQGMDQAQGAPQQGGQDAGMDDGSGLGGL